MARIDARSTILEYVREEAVEVKKCFTQFQFYSMVFAGAVIAAESQAIATNPLASIASIPVVLLLMAVARIGGHKFYTANRNYGYQLFLERTQPWGYPSVPGVLGGKWHPRMRDIGWEEGVRAWRIVQATLFEKMYYTPRNRGTRFWALRLVVEGFHPGLYSLKKRHLAYVAKFGRGAALHGGPGLIGLRRSPGYPWFLPEDLAQLGCGRYAPGSYVRNAFQVLVWLQIVSLIPVVVGAFVAFGKCNYLLGTALLILAGTVLVAVLLRRRRMEQRRAMLERGLSSIHSCSIVWQAVAIAHYRALAHCGPNHLEHYTEKLAAEARNIARHAWDIHSYIEGKYAAAHQTRGRLMDSDRRFAVRRSRWRFT